MLLKVWCVRFCCSRCLVCKSVSYLYLGGVKEKKIESKIKIWCCVCNFFFPGVMCVNLFLIGIWQDYFRTPERCIYIFVCVYISVCVSIYKLKYIYICVYLIMYMQIYTYYMCVSNYVYANIYILYMYKYVDIYVYIYTYTHVCKYGYMYM